MNKYFSFRIEQDSSNMYKSNFTPSKWLYLHYEKVIAILFKIYTIFKLK